MYYSHIKKIKQILHTHMLTNSVIFFFFQVKKQEWADFTVNNKQ